LRLVALPGMPMVRAGDDLAELILDALAAGGETLHDGDVLVLAQKIVSKAEGRMVDLRGVAPSARALALATETGKDPRLIELMLSESVEVVRHSRDVIVVAHRLGFVMANAGIDQSNVAPDDGEKALLLPRDPDASCAALRSRLREGTGADVAVIINDSHGRA
jgi:coenzyme F420-0:L-glutamate ligase/coenzyme F420-1:gamma-L-glutamate ligase